MSRAASGRRAGTKGERRATGAAPGERAPAEWTFLTNHAHVLIFLAREPESTLRRVAQAVGITERAVQRIVAELAEAGFLSRRRAGRRNAYEIHAGLALRHPIESHRTVRELLQLVNRGPEGGRARRAER
jgi:predicted transcriptional regulator